MSLAAGGAEALGSLEASGRSQVDALRHGAAVLARDENHLAAVALLWDAVGADPNDLLAHRALVTALKDAGDTDTAAAEYARFIDLSLKNDDVRRAAAELAHARALLGDMPQLDSRAAIVVSLGEVARAIETTPVLEPAVPAPQLAGWAVNPHPRRMLGAIGARWDSWLTWSGSRLWFQELLFIAFLAISAIAIVAMGLSKFR